MNKDKKKKDLIGILFIGLITCLIIGIVICVIIAKQNRNESEQPPVGADPTISPSSGNNSQADSTDIVIRNIEIEDFDDWGMGVLSNGKYYQLQYGVHVKDDSFKGSQIGKTSSENKLTLVKDNIYQYSEGASHFVDNNSAYYEFNGNEDVVLLDTGDVDQTINGVWVLSPDLLPKTSLYDFCENPSNIELVYYPTIEDMSYNYTIESAEDLIKSFRRVSAPQANSVETGYLTFDDGSGLLYGALVYYDYDSGECYLSPPSYSKLFFKANSQLEQYLKEYYLSLHNVD